MPDGSIANNQDLLPYKNESAQKSESGGTATDTIFASKNGSTYYFSSCGSSSRIKEENKIWFTDETAAQSAGYRLAKACE
jgi:DNA/RNA endonuclease YhcR with UshA esterase domain